MAESRFIQGLSNEERQSALEQVALWDRTTILMGLVQATRRGLGQNGYANEFDRRRAESAAWINEFSDPFDPHAMKLCRLLDHLGHRIDMPPDLGALHARGLEIEWRALRAVPDAKTIDELVRHVLCKLYEGLDAYVSSAPPAERERIARKIADALDSMDDEVRERIREAARLHDLSMQTLMRAGTLTAVGGGLAGLVGSAGFAAYTTLNATIAAISGLAGLTLPFGAYVTLSSLLAFLSNPLVVVPAIGIVVVWLRGQADQKLKAALVPMMVALACAKPDVPAARSRMRDLALHLAYRYEEFLDADPMRQVQLRRAFPAFRLLKQPAHAA